MKYYILKVFSCVDPEPLHGPYLTYGNMLKRARKLYQELDEQDILLWVRTGGGEKPMVGSFSGKELGT